MTRLHFVTHARKPDRTAGIKVGDSYYWWQFAYGVKQKSKTKPAHSRYATQSEFLGELMDMEDAVNAMATDDTSDIANQLREFASRVEEMGSECDEKRSNMPEQLQDSGSGETLQTRVDDCETLAQELNDAADSIEAIDTSATDEDKEAAKETGSNIDDATSERVSGEIQDALGAISWSYS